VYNVTNCKNRGWGIVIIIACVDEKGGMLFNNRRQSKDSVLTKHIMQMVGESKLWINTFSAGIFEQYIGDKVIIDDEFLSKIGKNDYCFIENISPNSLKDKANKIILYNWKRHYPADKFWDLALDEWNLVSEQDLVGSSHEKITERIYVRGNV